MRVFVTEGPDRDSGAVAIIVTLMAVALIVLSAFAVDIGNSYANSRQLSVAADASALAGANALGIEVPRGVTCEAALAAIDEQQIVKAAADEMNTKNNRLNGSGDSEPVDTVAVDCIDTDGNGATESIAVTVNNTREVKTFIAGIIGVNAINPRGSATAVFARIPVPGGLRPWAVCDVTAEFANVNQDETFFTGLDNKLGVCSKGPTSGNWGSVDFDDGSSAAGKLAKWTLDGYWPPPPVVIPGLLDADPGVTTSSSLADAFAAITGEVVSFPAVSQCVGSCTGTTAEFEATGVITALVCGVQYGGSVRGRL